MDRGEFQRVCDAAFHFLADEYQYRAQDSEQDPWYWTRRYFGAHAAVEVLFELRDHYIAVRLLPLQNGKLAPDFFERRRNSIDVIVLLDFLSTGLRPFPRGMTGRRIADAEVTQILESYAAAVRSYAADLLRGDFALLPAVQDYLARRA